MAVERRRRKRKRSGALIFVFLILALLLGSMYFVVRSMLTAILVDVQQLTNTTVEETIATEFLVLRQEYNVSAPSPGRLELTVREGEKVPKGAVVGYLTKTEGTSLETTSRVPLTAPEAGIFSLQVDGLESICSPGALADLDLANLFHSVQETELGKEDITYEGERVTAGKLLFKIVDNLSPSYLFCQANQTLSEQITVGQWVELQLDDLAAEPINGKISDSYEEKGQAYILIRISTVNNLEKYRLLKGNIIIDRSSCIVISPTMLVEKEGLTGVYLLKNGRASWQEVTIVAQDEQQLVVSGLEEGQWIITTPKLVKEGQRILSR